MKTRAPEIDAPLALRLPHSEVLSQAFGVFVRLWLAHTPRVAEEAQPGARVKAENRYGRFAQHVAD